MFVIIVSILLYTTLTQGLSTNAGQDYLDPILYQKHVQSPTGLYKYSYESNGNNGSPVLSGYTPEVDAARKAHLDAYLETQRRDFAQQKRVVNTRSFHSEAVKERTENVETPESINIPYSYKSSHVQNQYVTQRTKFDADSVNLFSGKPLDSSYRNDNNFHSSAQGVFQTTTPRPIIEFSSPNMENKVFVLPPPTVQHYEKIWPLPPIRFRDLEIQVNGQDWYDPRRSYSNRNVVSTPEFTKVPQNPFQVQQMTPHSEHFQNPLANQLSQSVHPATMEVVAKTNYVLQPNTFSLTADQPEVPDKRNTFFSAAKQQATPKSLYFQDHFANQLSQSVSPRDAETVSRTDHLAQPGTSGLTAHQADLMNYQLGVFNSGANIMPIDNLQNVNSPITKFISTVSHGDVKQDIATMAAQRAFNVIKEKYYS